MSKTASLETRQVNALEKIASSLGRLTAPTDAADALLRSFIVDIDSMVSDPESPVDEGHNLAVLANQARGHLGRETG
tara:strand:+ start:172 stop:402 length:231 start_codon:yes stop_codon:yes gene_type:complete